LNMQLAILILVSVLCQHAHARGTMYEVTGNCKCGRKQTGNQESGDYIINGQQADRNEYPWMVLLTNGTSLCGGSLISNQWILTAAHCTHGYEAGVFQVFLGTYNTKKLENKKNIVEMINHPLYEYVPRPGGGIEKMNYDYALLKMQEPVDFFTNQHIRPICLPTNPSGQYEGFPAIATGWGRINNFPVQNPDKLQEINLEVLSNKRCQELVDNVSNTKHNICANVPGQVGGTASGDSGGPLIVNVGGYYELVGVTSWGNPAIATVFARVTSIIGWIRLSTKDDWTSCPRK